MDRKVKILWFCSSLIKSESEATGLSWIHSLAHQLIDNPNIELYNVCQGMVSKLTHHKNDKIQQWEFPAFSVDKNGLPSSNMLNQILEIVQKVKPDLVHYWGTESFWPLLSSRGFITTPALLEIQGLKFTCYPFFSKGMSSWDRLRTIGLRELIKPDLSIFRQEIEFKKWGEFEKEMIQSIDNIAVQSDWVTKQVAALNPNANLHRTKILLRSAFKSTPPWDIKEIQRHKIFTSATSTAIPYKGFHVLIDAIYIIKKQYPSINLAIAGYKRKGIKKTGYERWIDRKIKKYGLTQHIEWLGQLNEKELISQLKNSHINVVPSFVESYSLAMDESLTIGVPTIASNTTAMPELADNENNALLVEPGNPLSIAKAISSVFDSDILSESLSKNALKSRRSYHESVDAGFQLEIYSKILNLNLT